MKITPALYLIPVGISDAPVADVIPTGVTELLTQIRFFIVENVRTARRWLRRCNPGCDIDGLTFYELNRHTDPSEVAGWLDALRHGEPMGVMSEAGCPGVADPGAQAVTVAQREGLRVIPLAGPSSILMALMASGFNGQGFTFHGYLPIDENARSAAIKRLEKTARTTGFAQIFIETPYRNRQMLKALIDNLHPDTLLCVALGVTDQDKEQIRTMKASSWKHHTDLPAKTPAVFIIN